MGDDNANDVQDPAEPKKVETVIETHEADTTKTESKPADGE